MREFRSFEAAGIPKEFDAEFFGEEPIVSVEETESRIEMSYSFPGFYLSKDVQDLEGEAIEFKQVDITKTGFLSESGKPLLPSFGRYVQIPFDCDYKVTVRKRETIHLDDVLVLPAQEKLTDSGMDKPSFEYDKDFYSTDELYPHELVEVTGPYYLDGYNALAVHVRPFQYNPFKKKLVGYGNISVSIEFSAKEEDAEEDSPAEWSTSREAYGNLFLNPRRRSVRSVSRRRRGLLFDTTPCGPELLIIYHKEFKDSVDRLELWKNMRGLRTESISIDTIGNEVGGIKTYIRTKRAESGSRLRYVLLFGDVGLIESEPMGNYVTDYYYSTRIDPPSASDLVTPWLSIGRIPVNNPVEGVRVVNQIIDYERNPPSDPDYYSRMTFGAFFQDDLPQDGRADRKYMKTLEAVRRHMEALGFDVDRAYVSNNPNPEYYRDGTPVPQEVKDSIISGNAATQSLIDSTSEGQLITGHRDHGNWNGWSHPSFKLNDLDSVTTTTPTIFFSINCLTGKFNLSGTKDCFAEKMLRMDGGAPSLVAATDASGTWRNDSMIKALFDSVWPGVLPTFPSGSTASYPVTCNRLGDILNYAKAYLIPAHSGGPSGIKHHFEIYHIIGDPTLELWSAEPRNVDLKCFVRLRDLHIKLSECPRGSVITIWFEGEILKRIEPAFTHMKLPLKDLWSSPTPPTSWRELSVCFRAPGYRFRRLFVQP